MAHAHFSHIKFLLSLLSTFLILCTYSFRVRLTTYQEPFDIWMYWTSGWVQFQGLQDYFWVVLTYNVLRQSFHIAVLPLLSKFKLFLVVHKNNKNAEERHWPIPFTLSGPAAGIIETEKRITEMSSSPTKGPLLSQASGWLAFFQTVYFKNKRHRGKDIRRDIFNHRRWRINTLDFTFFVFGVLAQEVSFVQLGFVKTSLRDRK